MYFDWNNKMVMAQESKGKDLGWTSYKYNIHFLVYGY